MRDAGRRLTRPDGFALLRSTTAAGAAAGASRRALYSYAQQRATRPPPQQLSTLCHALRASAPLPLRQSAALTEAPCGPAHSAGRERGPAADRWCTDCATGVGRAFGCARRAHPNAWARASSSTGSECRGDVPTGAPATARSAAMRPPALRSAGRPGHVGPTWERRRAACAPSAARCDLGAVR